MIHKAQNRVKAHLTWACLLGVMLLAGSCGSSKTQATPEQLAQLQSLAEGRNFTFEAEFALPQTSQAYIGAANATLAQAGGNSLSRISLKGEGYFLRIKGDSIEAYLPYYGVRDNFSEYGRPDGIDLDSELEDLKVDKKGSKSYQMRFFARKKTERFQITLDLFPGGKSNLLIYSGQRDAIRYEGRTVPTAQME